jgi:hypothetical protein
MDAPNVQQVLSMGTAAGDWVCCVGWCRLAPLQKSGQNMPTSKQLRAKGITN